MWNVGEKNQWCFCGKFSSLFKLLFAVCVVIIECKEQVKAQGISLINTNIIICHCLNKKSNLLLYYVY